VTLRPPTDFRPTLPVPKEPSAQELRKLWDEHQRRYSQRQRDRAWRESRELARRTAADQVVAAAGAERLPGFLKDASAMGSDSRSALRPTPQTGRVEAVGVDTWSPAWYVAERSPLEQALMTLASRRAGLASVLPEPILEHRVGWFSRAGLAFAEGHPEPGGLGAAASLPERVEALETALADYGLPVGPELRAGIRRIDVAADVRLGSVAEGLTLLNGAATVQPSGGKVVSYRSARAVESVLLKTMGGRTVARIYDKGLEAGTARRGELLRPEAQLRFVKGSRRQAEEISADYLRAGFIKRFQPIWMAATGVEAGGVIAVAGRLLAAIETGQVAPSRARTLAGHLVMALVDAPVGAQRTRYDLERDCRELGLALDPAADSGIGADIATVLDECLEPALWR